MKTQVIHIKDAPANWQEDSLYVYIGRYRRVIKSSFAWGNPIHMINTSDKERQRVIALYKLHLEKRLTSDPNFADKIRKELRGHILICYCKPKSCHGDILSEIADRL